MAYDNSNRGSIWKNEKKQTENHPDFAGTYTDENGKEYWVSAWKRKPDAKPKAPALNFTLKAKEQQPAQQSQVSGANSDPFDDGQDDGSGIPF